MKPTTRLAVVTALLCTLGILEVASAQNAVDGTDDSTSGGAGQPGAASASLDYDATFGALYHGGRR